MLTGGSGNINTSTPHCLTDRSVGPQRAQEGRQRARYANHPLAFSVSSTICQHNTHFASQAHSQVPQKSAVLFSPDAGSPRGQRGCTGTSAPSPTQAAGSARLPRRPLNKDAAELSSFRGLHGFTSLQKQINSHHLCLNKSLGFTARYGTTCAALTNATAHKRNSTESDWFEWKISVVNKT